jgi:hypothetical protein
MDLQQAEPIAGTAVRCLIRSEQTDGRFSVPTDELGPRRHHSKHLAPQHHATLPVVAQATLSGCRRRAARRGRRARPLSPGLGSRPTSPRRPARRASSPPYPRHWKPVNRCLESFDLPVNLFSGCGLTNCRRMTPPGPLLGRGRRRRDRLRPLSGARANRPLPCLCDAPRDRDAQPARLACARHTGARGRMGGDDRAGVRRSRGRIRADRRTRRAEHPARTLDAPLHGRARGGRRRRLARPRCRRRGGRCCRRARRLGRSTTAASAARRDGESARIQSASRAASRLAAAVSTYLSWSCASRLKMSAGLSVVSDTQSDRGLEVGGKELEESAIELALHRHNPANLLI